MKKTSLTLISLLPVAALFVAACAEPGDLAPTEEAASAATDGETAGHLTHGHMMPMPGAARHARKAADDGDSWGQSSYNFTYRGGPVISAVKVFTVFWNSTVPNQSHINDFYTSITQSAYIDWLSEYNTSKQTIGRGNFIGSYIDTSAPASRSLTDQDIQKEIGRLINAGKVPAPDADTLYMVHFPAGVSISMDGNQSCQQFCAYHGTFTNGGKNVYYGVMPDFSGGCQACGGTSDKMQNTTIVTSHELVEAITDPAIGLANQTNQESYLAWYDDQGGEIGDVCQTELGSVNGWAVQAEYSMQAGSCVVTRSSGSGGGSTGGNGGGSTGGGAPSCDHGVCFTGGPLESSCGPCTAKICQAAPHCCGTTWDASCVQKATSLCGKHCQ